MRFCGLLLLTSLAVAISACGGKSTSDSNPTKGGTGGTGGSGGSSGSGGTIASGGTAGTGGAPTACIPGGSCTQEGSTCTPPGCCQCTYICKGAAWQPGECPSCPAKMCPAVTPNDGDPCNECENPVGQPCSIGGCAPIATCDGQHWHVVIPPCPPPGPCGVNPPCSGGELCVHPGGLTPTDQSQCEPNPCGPSQPVSCECAGALCTVGFCKSTSPSDVYCECPNC